MESAQGFCQGNGLLDEQIVRFPGEPFMFFLLDDYQHISGLHAWLQSIAI